MKKSAKSAISFVLIIMIISSLCVPSFAQSNNTDSEFIINIYDESGSPVADAADICIALLMIELLKQN